MIRILITIFSIFTSALSMAQTSTFSMTLGDLFFGFDITKATGSLVDSLMKIPQLHHVARVVMQSDINLNFQLKTQKEAWASYHIFLFNESPIPGLKIDSGFIEVKIGEVDSIKTLLDLHWKIQFANKAKAIKYFRKLKDLFNKVSTNKKYGFDKDVGDIAQFSTRKPGDKGIRDITLFLNQSKTPGKYEITLLLLNEFINE